MFYRPLVAIFLGSLAWTLLFTWWLYWDGGAWSEIDSPGYTVVCTAPGVIACLVFLFRLIHAGKERWHHWLATFVATVVLPGLLLLAVFFGTGFSGSMAGCNVYLGDSVMSGEHVEAWFCEELLPRYSASVELYPAGRHRRRFLLGYAEPARMGRVAASIDPTTDEIGRFRARPRRVTPLGPGQVRIHFVDGTTRDAQLEP